MHGFLTTAAPCAGGEEQGKGGEGDPRRLGDDGEVCGEALDMHVDGPGGGLVLDVEADGGDVDEALGRVGTGLVEVEREEVIGRRRAGGRGRVVGCPVVQRGGGRRKIS